GLAARSHPRLPAFPPRRSSDLWHVSDAWKRCHEPNVLLVHYDDLLDDLEAQMRGLAARLDIRVLPERMSSRAASPRICASRSSRSEEHTSELQSRSDLVCRPLL